MKRLQTLIVLLVNVVMLAVAWAAPPAPMLPQIDNGQITISGWLMSEKLDGVRGYWDGQQLWSKNGTLFQPPSAFVADLPPFALEGELWGGRGSFETTAAVVKRLDDPAGWLRLRFAIFDVPLAPGSFSRRVEKASAWFAAHPSPYAFVIAQQPVQDRAELQRELARIERLGGEGLIVRDPEALYLAGRRPEILKVKSFQDDEAVVIKHLSGQGKNAKLLGALLVELPDGTRFKIGAGFSDEQRRSPPPLGTTITFKHNGRYRSGLPKFPVFLRIRRDLGL
ncbi:MAG TPA: DNA ligase [Desulfobulbaceae bacterium]|nr:MAG: DNA ligase [Deltaproteobacteria bacterium RIFOXYD12_FULL_53_23]HCC54065.1 DNA ligase [Desulfobulbaceae bacterium]